MNDLIGKELMLTTSYNTSFIFAELISIHGDFFYMQLIDESITPENCSMSDFYINKAYIREVRVASE